MRTNRPSSWQGNERTFILDCTGTNLPSNTMFSTLRCFSLVLIIAGWVVAAMGQQAPPPKPSPDNDVVKISTNLIQLDITVVDRDRKPITDLRPEEVEIYENGRKQDITNFDLVTRKLAVQTTTEPSAVPLPPSTNVRREDVRRSIAFVVDDLTMSFGDVRETRDSLKKFVREQMREGDLVAIIRTGAGIGALQQFTADRRLLLAAIDKIQFNMSGSAKIGLFNPISASLADEVSGNRSSREFERDVNEFRESIFASGTLGAVNYVIRGMKDLPGRKSITLISDGVPLMVTDERGMPRFSRVFDQLRSLTDLANRASVVIYTIDARGVVFDGGFTAEDDLAGLTGRQIEARLQERRDSVLDSQEGLRYLAKQTGGFGFFLNGINRGIQRVLDDQTYYLVGYVPNDETFDPKKNRFNTIEVKVLRKDARVRYRSGFFAVPTAEIPRAKTSALQTLYDAFTSPFTVSDIELKLNALFTVDENGSPYLRSLLHIDPEHLTFTKDETGKYKASFDLISATFGANGVVEDGQRSTYSVILKPEMYDRLRSRGLVYDFAFKLKKAGAYQMRVALRDTTNNMTGSASQFVEVPNLKKGKLAMSGTMLAAVSITDWNRLDTLAPEAGKDLTNPVADTAAKQFRRGSVLTYQTAIFNGKRDSDQKLNLTLQAKLFSEVEMIFEGKPVTVNSPSAAGTSYPWTGSLLIGKELPPGNYTLQLLVTDGVAGEKANTISQFVTFEIVP